MTYHKSIAYPGWIYSEANDVYISPKGRLANYPGSPFTGQISKGDLAKVKKETEIIQKSPQKQEEKVANKSLEAKLIKTVKVGNITINWIRVD